jgi:hypothetical protein
MSSVLDFGIEGIGVWAPELPDWQTAQRTLVDNALDPAMQSARPAAAALAPGERRRTPESVLIAVEAAQQACAMANRAARELPHVFASAYGDLAINDYLCATLARAPGEISPTKFHNSVHNAPAGYWAIANGCMRASSAVSAGAASFGAGLLDAAVRVCGEAEPVLLVAYDLAACGPLLDTIPSRSVFASAFVLAPWSPRAVARARLRVGAGVATLAPIPPLLHASHAGNPSAAGLSLLVALARREPAVVRIAAAPSLHLDMEISF